MGKYEGTMETIVKERFKDIKKRRVTRDNGDEGFEWEIKCSDCTSDSPSPLGLKRSYNCSEDIRKVRGGSMCGGRCYKFISLEEFWDAFSDVGVINPETGEIVYI